MLENFYTLNQIESQGEGKYLCRITLNAAHPILQGIFRTILLPLGCVCCRLSRILQKKLLKRNYS